MQLEPAPQSIPHELQWLFAFFATQLPLQQYRPDPHEVPCATLRVHVSLWTVFVVLHAPAAQLNVVTVRVRVALVSHASTQGHAGNPGVTVVPQDLPSVTSGHETFSVVTTLLQVLLVHFGVVTVRDLVPVSAQVVAPVHELNVLKVTGPQSASSTQPTHALLASSQTFPQGFPA